MADKKDAKLNISALENECYNSSHRQAEANNKGFFSKIFSGEFDKLFTPTINVPAFTAAGMAACIAPNIAEESKRKTDRNSNPNPDMASQCHNYAYEQMIKAESKWLKERLIDRTAYIGGIMTSCVIAGGAEPYQHGLTATIAPNKINASASDKIAAK